MAASSIPNLNTLRKPRANLQGKAGRRDQCDNDAIIRSTDGDASSSRISAVQAGYLDDPFAKFLSPAAWSPRLPLMNRGTYIRTTALDQIVEKFLKSSTSRKQIVSLGAGSDTRYFRLKQQRLSDFSYHELDFRENTISKMDQLKSQQAKTIIKQLCDVDLDQAVSKDGDLHLDTYHIHAVDLRTLVEIPWLDQGQPTLIISECCLIYLPPEQADRVLNLFSKHLSNTASAIVIYEPFRPNDAFGRTMIRNLTTRGIVLETIQKYAELQEQRNRLDRHGFQAKAADTEFIFRRWLSQTEKDRISTLEMMDEVSDDFLIAVADMMRSRNSTCWLNTMLLLGVIEDLNSPLPGKPWKHNNAKRLNTRIFAHYESADASTFKLVDITKTKNEAFINACMDIW